MSMSGLADAFAESFNSIPRNARLAQVFRRISGEFSPIPALNTKTSIPLSEAAIEPIPDASR
jgi:hypothetical protein